MQGFPELPRDRCVTVCPTLSILGGALGPHPSEHGGGCERREDTSFSVSACF